MNPQQVMIQKQYGHNKGMKYNVKNTLREELIVMLLVQRDADAETISRYIKSNLRTTKQYITRLRKLGFHITLTSYQGNYHYVGFFE